MFKSTSESWSGLKNVFKICSSKETLVCTVQCELLNKVLHGLIFPDDVNAAFVLISTYTAVTGL